MPVCSGLPTVCPLLSTRVAVTERPRADHSADAHCFDAVLVGRALLRLPAHKLAKHAHNDCNQVHARAADAPPALVGFFSASSSSSTRSNRRDCRQRIPIDEHQ